MENRPKGYRRAIGLSFDSQTAPIINSKGEHRLADQIVKVAKRYGVPIVERPALACSLSAIDTDQEIPEELYEAVAVLLSELDALKIG